MERVSGAASRAESEWVCGSGAREFRTFKIFVYIFLIYIDINIKISAYPIGSARDRTWHTGLVTFSIT